MTFFDLPGPGLVQQFENWAAEVGSKTGLDPALVRKALRPGHAPDIAVRQDFALELRLGSAVFGACHLWNVQQVRQLEDEFECDAAGRGVPNHISPQTLSGRTIQIARYDLYLGILEEVLGGREIITIADQRSGIIAQEVWRGPVGVLGGGVRRYRYEGCWLESLGRPLDAKGSRVVSVDATLRWTRRRAMGR